jgi:hypothetical protein
MMTHPQREELRAKLQDFLEVPQEPSEFEHFEKWADRVLIVYEPDTKARISFTWSITVQANHPIQRTARMQFIWPRFTERERVLASELGLPPPLSTVAIPPQFRGGPPLPDVTVCDVEEIDQAVDLCLTVLERVFDTPVVCWLWITDIPDKRNWPNPLPRSRMP